jgi:hypothetical protein
MTVYELLEILKTYPPDKTMEVFGVWEGQLVSVSGVTLDYDANGKECVILDVDMK